MTQAQSREDSTAVRLNLTRSDTLSEISWSLAGKPSYKSSTFYTKQEGQGRIKDSPMKVLEGMCSSSVVSKTQLSRIPHSSPDHRLLLFSGFSPWYLGMAAQMTNAMLGGGVWGDATATLSKHYAPWDRQQWLSLVSLSKH